MRENLKALIQTPTQTNLHSFQVTTGERGRFSSFRPSFGLEPLSFFLGLHSCPPAVSFLPTCVRLLELKLKTLAGTRSGKKNRERKKACRSVRECMEWNGSTFFTYSSGERQGKERKKRKKKKKERSRNSQTNDCHHRMDGWTDTIKLSRKMDREEDKDR